MDYTYRIGDDEEIIEQGTDNEAPQRYKSSSNKRPDKGECSMCSLREYVAIDVETTGLSPSDEEIIEFGAVFVRDGQVVDTFSSLANPGRSIPPVVVSKTGITDAMVSEARPIADVLLDFLHFIKDYPLVGYNTHFDVNFIYDSALRHYKHGIDNSFVDVMQIARRVITGLHSYKLTVVAHHCGIVNEHAHRALDDALCTMTLYERFKGCLYNGMVLPESAAFGGYDYNTIFANIQRMIGFDENNVTLKVLKSSASIYMFGSVAFYIRLNSRTQCLDTKLDAAQVYVSQIPGASFSAGASHFPIASTPENCGIIREMVNALYIDRRDSQIGTAFGCCNDFIRCSDAMKCLKADDPDYRGCQYRRNLESGKVFYGKNKNI